jgi:hypothetical protein
MSFELTGNSLRSSRNTCTGISGGSSSGTIKLPNNSVITAAYLYWSGSGGIDTQVTFIGQAVNSVNSDTTYIETFDSRNYFSAKADVTHLVSNSRSTRYTVSGVTFDGSSAYCNTKGAYAGWALAVIYESSTEPLRVINVFDGFKSFWGEHFSLIPNNFVIAPNPSNGNIRINSLFSSKNTNIVVYNLISAQVAEISNIKSFPYTINLSNLSNGVYYLKLSSGNQTITKKIFISK